MLPRCASRVFLLVALLVLLAPRLAQAQVRIEGVDVVMGRWGDGFWLPVRFKTERGVLTIDPAARRLRVDAGTATLLDVPFARLIALREEQSRYGRHFLRPSDYLTLHYRDDEDVERYRILRLPESSVATVTAALADVTVDQSPIKTSFAGLPVYVKIGDRLDVTNAAGAVTRGRITALTAASLQLAGHPPIGARSVRKITVADPVWDGALAGAMVTIQPALAASFEGCSCRGVAWLFVGAGVAIGAGLDAAFQRTAYRAPASRAASFLITPVATRHGAGLAMSVTWH